MKAEITLDGRLEITPESTTDLYALRNIIAYNYSLQGSIDINDESFKEKVIEQNSKPPITLEDIPF